MENVLSTSTVIWIFEERNFVYGVEILLWLRMM